MKRTRVSWLARLCAMVALWAALLGALGSGAARAAVCPQNGCLRPFTLSVAQATLLVPPGTLVTVPVTLQNLAPVNRTIYLGANGSMGWPLQLTSDAVQVPAGGKAVFYVTVNVPPLDAYYGTDHITVKAADSMYRQDLNIDIIVADPPPPIP